MLDKKEPKIINARKINKIRCIAGLSMCTLVIVLTLVALMLNVNDFFKDSTPESGLGTLRMYTTLSNLLAAVAASLCIPFQIDGLRRNKYKLPHWIVGVMYVGVVGVFITFFMAATLISITQGFVLTMFQKSNLFLHTINPIVITILFTLIISDAHIKFHESFFAMIPLLIYCFIYFLFVFVLKVWRDHYETNTFIPWPVSLIGVVSIAFGIAQGLRVLHNLNHKYVEDTIVRYYMKSEDYVFPKIGDAIAHLAEVESAFYYKDDDIYIPVDIIKLLSDRYEASKLPLDIQYDIYLENYLKNIGINPTKE